MGGLLRPAHTHESLTRELRPAFGANRGQGRQGLGLAREPAAVPQATPEYTPPDYPERPQFKPPESLDLRKALKSGVEAGLTTEEFNSVLGQIGVVNESEQAEALQSFERLMGDYQDEMGRMEFEQEGERDFEADIEDKRRYGLGLAKEAREEKRGLAKEAREVLGAERKFGLDLSKHGLEIEKAGKTKWAGSPQEALFKRKTALGVAGLKAEKTFKKEQRTSKARLKAADTKHVRSLEKELRKQEAELRKQEAEGRNVLVDGKAEPLYEATKHSVQELKDKIGELKGTKKAEPKDLTATMPPAEQHNKKIIRDTETGKRYKSDGTQWIEID